MSIFLFQPQIAKQLSFLRSYEAISKHGPLASSMPAWSLGWQLQQGSPSELNIEGPVYIPLPNQLLSKSLPQNHFLRLVI